MRIAILTTFRHMPESYSLVNDIRDQIKTLKKYGHEVVFYAQEGCKGKGIECEMRAVIPHFKIEKGVVNLARKEEMIKIFERELKDYDVVITHDIMYLSHFVTHRDAVMQADLPNVKWIHWCHSGVGSSMNIKMPRSKYIYMNYKDVKRFAKAIGVELKDVRVVFNDKDPRLFFDWNPISYMISERYDVFNVDIMQTYPVCSTRMDSKGVDHIIKIFGKLKDLGNKVFLVFVNANARRRKEEIERKLEYAYNCGLNEREVLFTSTLGLEYEAGLPRQVVRDLMQVSNLFIFPTVSEVCSNILLEASITKQLIVLNKDFPALFDFGQENKTCLGFYFGSLIRPGFKYQTEEQYLNLAKQINSELVHSKINQQFQLIKHLCNIDTIYKKQLEPILYEDY